ncbi:TPA: site-2 protease family protein [Candidatus Bipolaricaulota bacterium]|nr:site-2 protease family protein [Candidatus Bipolaricaulota bacterium]
MLFFGSPSLAHFIALAIALIVALDVHEFFHAWMASALGDPTPRVLGRLTLNPLAHMDPLGTLMIFLAGFGWGKPVPVNPYNLRHGAKTGMALVSLAGPLANLTMAALFAIPVRLGIVALDLFNRGLLPTPGQLVATIMLINVTLAIFNLIPIAPLDGFRVVVGLLPYRWAYAFAQYEAYGPAILIFLILAGSFTRFDILGEVMVPFIYLVLRLLVGV